MFDRQRLELKMGPALIPIAMLATTAMSMGGQAVMANKQKKEQKRLEDEAKQREQDIAAQQEQEQQTRADIAGQAQSGAAAAQASRAGSVLTRGFGGTRSILGG